jgi:molybdopterin/thiamine biosynthesis adenylyltransferase
MNPEAYYRRIRGVLHPEKLGGKKTFVVGLGSGGSRVAIELGRVGVELLLIELPGECIQEHNIVRYPLGYEFLGEPKNRAVARHIATLNPSTKVTVDDLDVSAEKEKFAGLVAKVKPDLVIVCVDNEQAKHAVNEVAVRIGVGQVGAGVYDGGIGGEITIARPTSACYACIADHLQLARQTPRTERNIDYNNLNASEIRSTCALNLDIEQIALIQARIALHLLLDGEPDLTGIPDEINLCVFCNRTVPNDPVLGRPLHCEFFHIPRNPDCLVCGASSPDVEAEAHRILKSLATTEEARGV